MRFRHSTSFPADATAVFAMFSDPAFRDRVCTAQGSLRSEVSLALSDRGGEALVEQVLPAVGIPSYAAKFVGEEIEVRRFEKWRGSEYANLEIAIPGKPGDLVAELTLSQEAGQSVLTYDGELTVSIPFIGGRLEKFVGEMFTSSLDIEADIARAYLAGE
jgi:hypothetical protein